MAFEAVMFAEIVYYGNLLVKFIDDLEDKPKDYSIIFVSIIIAWLIITMGLIFRQAYEEKEMEDHHTHLEGLVVDHYQKVKAKKQAYKAVEAIESGERVNMGAESEGHLKKAEEQQIEMGNM